MRNEKKIKYLEQTEDFQGQIKAGNKVIISVK